MKALHRLAVLCAAVLGATSLAASAQPAHTQRQAAGIQSADFEHHIADSRRK